MTPEALALDGAAADSCPSSPMPCERLCWALDGAVEDDGGGNDLEDLPSVSAAADLDVLGAALVGCAREGARRCWDDALAGQLTDEVSWTGLLFECAAPFVSGQ